MVKRVILVHGWEGNPDNCWFPWMKKELESRGVEVIIPAMPDPENPRIDAWVPALAEAIGSVDGDTFFVGHSIGCQAIMRLLAGVDGKVGGLVFVAGFFNLHALETEEEKEIAAPWLETPIDTDAVRGKTDDIVAVFSDDDPDVSVDEADVFAERLGAKIIVEKGKGHFSDDYGVTELPVVLEELLRIF